LCLVILKQVLTPPPNCQPEVNFGLNAKLVIALKSDN
jgi:hypothetical protein